MSKKRILIVDDEKNVTQYIKTALEKTGQYEVREENLGANAVKTAEEFSPDLVLLDVLMPDVEGGVIAARFESHPRFKNLPIVFLTGTLSPEKSGMIGGLPFLAKPVTPDHLTKCLEQHLKDKK